MAKLSEKGQRELNLWVNKWGKKEKQRIILHIYINFIELQVLKKLFNKNFVNKILKRERTFRGIKKAWEIVLTKEDLLKKIFN